MRRAIRDFGQNMVIGAKNEIASHLRPEDLDEIAAMILERCSDSFLDKALEQRLKTIDARSLINALARAERLGYEKGDILEGQPEGQPERVVPAAKMHSPRLTQVNLNATPQPPFPQAYPGANAVQPVAQHTPATSDLKCRLCWREFRHTKYYEYVSCDHCYCYFKLLILGNSMFKSSYAQKLRRNHVNSSAIYAVLVLQPKPVSNM